MTPFRLTIFLSAFLLFQVQPLAGKHILPWFGGSPAVWTTCMLFFQVGLLVGYGYAHWLIGWQVRRFQGRIHLFLLIGSLLFLPIVFHDTWKPVGADAPIWHILALLFITIGGPYFVLSTTGPLLQAWYSKIHPDSSPYRLYALSNAGSLLGLLTYPFVFEPLLTRYSQALIWSCAYGIFALLCGRCAWQLQQGAQGSTDQGESEKVRFISPGIVKILSWLFMAACGSVLLLASTNQMCQEVAVVPFLWVLPLSLYLVTFIVAFEREKWYCRMLWLPLLAIAIVLVSLMLEGRLELPLNRQILVYSAALFTGCMVCHGELARSKPASQYLTLFYLAVACGGALGGFFVALVAPLLFTGYWEYHLGLVGATVIAMAVLFFDPGSFVHYGRRLWVWLPILFGFSAFVNHLYFIAISETHRTLVVSRSFYGVLQVDERKDWHKGVYRELSHGEILHGMQFMDNPWCNQPVSYYGKGTGIWLAMQYHPNRLNHTSYTVGVVGLGTGTLAAFGRQGDLFRFYEINPDMLRLSNEWFRYRKNSLAKVETVLGDGRIQLEHELAQGRNQQFDILVADAFSSDAVPLHLLTRECAHLYRQHLKDDGILAVNITNQHLDLKPVALGMAQALQWQAVLVDSKDNLDEDTWAATWMLITANQSFLNLPFIRKVRTDCPTDAITPLLWTDEYTSLFHVLN